MPNKVFISYRREDSRYQARRVYDAFVHALPPDTVFMDVDSIPPGADFVEILEGWVQQCDVLLALIGPNWLNSIDPRTGLRRLDNPEDFVRIEVRGALERKIPVVPVLLDATEMPTAAELPDDIKALRRRHAEFVDFRTFDSDVQRLIKRLKIGKLPGEATDPRAADNGTRRAGVVTVWALPAAKSLLLVAAMAVLLAIGVAAYVVNAWTPVDASVAVADFAKSEEGRRTAEARAKEAVDALALAEKARQQAEAKAADAAAALVKTEENRRAAEARADDAADALKKSEKARQEAEAKVAAQARAPEELSLKADASRLASGQAGSVSGSSISLLTDISGRGRWTIAGSASCANRDGNYYSAALSGGVLTWTSGSGNIDVEGIVDSNKDQFLTTTRISRHTPGETSFKPGTNWTYSRLGNQVRVQNNLGHTYTLQPCP